MIGISLRNHAGKWFTVTPEKYPPPQKKKKDQQFEFSFDYGQNVF